MENNNTVNNNTKDEVINTDTSEKTNENNDVSDIKSPYKDEKELEAIKEDNLVAPTTTYSNIVELLGKINKLTEEQIKKLYSIKEKTALGINMDSVRMNIPDDGLLVKDNSEYSNDPSIGDVSLTTRQLEVGSKNGKITGDSITAILSYKTGIGGITQVPLWHSGFWLTLLPIKNSDIINLEIEIANNTIELGRSTSALIYSNYSVIYNRIITNFIISHTKNSSLDVPISELTKYIKIQDLYPIVNALLYSMNPTGHNYVRSCINSSKLDDDMKPLCDYILEATIDFRKLLFVNRKSLTKEMLLHMSKRTPNSVSLTEVIEYRNNLVNENSITLTTNNDTNIKFNLVMPMLDKYILSGEAWVNNIITNTEKLFTESTDDIVKNNLISEMSVSAILGMYNSFINSIEFDGYLINEQVDIDIALEALSADDTIIIKLIDAIKDFINNNTIAMVGIVNYDCPKCKTSQSENRVINFKEIIPINVVESFFDLCTLRIKKLEM